MLKTQDCNKLFKEPKKGPKTGKEVSIKTQKRYMRGCKVIPLSDVRAFFEDGRTSKDVKNRFINAGGVVSSSVDNATHIISSKNSSSGIRYDGEKYILTISSFASLYYNLLYSECERFKADVTHSPKTFRRITVDGPTHKKWVDICSNNSHEMPIAAKTTRVSNIRKRPKATRATVDDTLPQTTPAKSSVGNLDFLDANVPKKLMKRNTKKCTNDIEPVTLDKFEDFDEQQLRQLIAIGKDRNKKHCLLANSAYQIYETAAKMGDKPRNPLNPSHTFTNAEIKQIIRLTKKPLVQQVDQGQDKVVPPRMRIRFLPQTINGIAFYKVVVASSGFANKEFEVYSLGFIPAEIDIKNSGSTDMTSSTLIVQIKSLFENGKIITVDDQGILRVNAVTCKELRKPIEHWIDVNKATKLQRFRAMALVASNM